jgi:CheY-like chemotaxis protein
MRGICASIFYVEDNPGDVLLMRTAFVELGRLVTFAIALDGDSALRRLDEFASASAGERPDLILMDLNLPGISGLELLQYLSEDANLGIPVIVVSASRAEQDRESCLRLGCAAYLEKPSSFSGYRTLVREIDRVLTAH